MALKDVFFVLTSLLALTAAVKNLQWKNCDASAPILVANLTVLPYPILLKNGVKLRITAALNVKYTVSVKIEKKFWAWWPRMPCVKNMGSCDYKIGLKKIPTQTIGIPDVDVPSFLTDGKYRVNADVRQDNTGDRLFCLNAEFTIDS